MWLAALSHPVFIHLCSALNLCLPRPPGTTLYMASRAEHIFIILVVKQTKRRTPHTTALQPPLTPSSPALFTWDVHFSRGRLHLVAGPGQRAAPFSAAACSVQAPARVLAPPNLGPTPACAGWSQARGQVESNWNVILTELSRRKGLIRYGYPLSYSTVSG